MYTIFTEKTGIVKRSLTKLILNEISSVNQTCYDLGPLCLVR